VRQCWPADDCLNDVQHRGQTVLCHVASFLISVVGHLLMTEFHGSSSIKSDKQKMCLKLQVMQLEN